MMFKFTLGAAIPFVLLPLLHADLKEKQSDGGTTAQPPGSAAIAAAHLLEGPLSATIRDEIKAFDSGRATPRQVNAFPVDASSSEWQNSGIRVIAGQRVTIVAAPKDRWIAGNGQVDAGGYPGVPEGSGNLIFHEGTIGADSHWGALICAIGEGVLELGNPGRQAEAGTKTEFTAKKTGYVYLICNGMTAESDDGSGFEGNSGIIHVKVTVSDPAGGADTAARPSPGAGPAIPANPGIATDDAGSGDSAAIARQMLGPLRAVIREAVDSSLAGKRGDPDNFPVDCSSPAWQNSGIRVKAGQHVTIEAPESETWDIGWGPTNAAGYGAPRDSGAGEPVYHTGTKNDDWRWGALICAVGDGRGQLEDADHQVQVGLKRGFKADSDGFLYFMANDNRHLFDGRNGFEDNNGVIHVKITVGDSAPAPDQKVTAHPASARADTPQPTFG